MEESLRDKFAIAAMQGLLARDFETDHSYSSYFAGGKFVAEMVACHAYMAADAMMKEREKKRVE